MKFLRLISFLTATVFLLSAFSGCSKEEIEEETYHTTEESTLEVEEPVEFHPYIEKKEYNEDFYFTVHEINRSKLYWVEESSSNVLTDAIYNRQIAIRDHLGVNVYGTSVIDADLYLAKLKTAAMNKDNSMHLMVSHPYHGVSSFISENLLVDFNEIDAIDLDASYWNRDLMEQLSLNGRLYLGFSDFNIGITSVIAFNKEIYDQYKDHIGESLYSLVDDHRWTLEKMISVASLVSIDKSSDGKTVDDTFGIVGDYDLGYIIMLQASDINLIEQDDSGDYVVSVLSERTKEKAYGLVEKLQNLAKSQNAYFVEEHYIEVPREIFADGRALMRLTETHLLPDLLSADLDFGVLPYPMYDEGQRDVGYRHMQWGGYLCIPAYLKNPDMVFETIELLSYLGEDVNVAYYDRLLGKQVADVPDDRRMLDIVWDSLCSDIGFTYQGVVGSEFYMLTAKVASAGGSGNIASFVAMYESPANRKLKKYVMSTSK